ncbi:hypothetical protein VR7878_03095 [Vibrio ruber DSM 16370]|uniref:Uncharacterized protein n=2 Tax=Vibrio ruber TaxID=184755 RepID=A0A1R4LQK8_VIBR1|nr:hypothetical protein VR7878_03095 [Vibrio ruber DSM 16370]
MFFIQRIKGVTQYGENEMTLNEIIQNIDAFDSEHTIYIDRDWNSDSEAIVCNEPSDGQAPEGYEYFLEVFLVQEIMKDLGTSSVDRIIAYAQNDA